MKKKKIQISEFYAYYIINVVYNGRLCKNNVHQSKARYERNLVRYP